MDRESGDPRHDRNRNRKSGNEPGGEEISPRWEAFLKMVL